MRLTVKQNDREVNKLEFLKGPIYLGRHAQCQVFLPSRSVSRQHAVLYLTEPGKWMVKDLGSANRTLCNGKEVSEAPIKSGDRLQIGDCVVEVNLEDRSSRQPQLHLEDTHAPIRTQPRHFVRNLDDDLAPPLRVPSHRVGQLLSAARALAQATGASQAHQVILDQLWGQFNVQRAWCRFRYEEDGPMAREGGRRLPAESFRLTDARLIDHIDRACEAREFQFIINQRKVDETSGGESIIIATLVGTDGTYGGFFIESRRGKALFSLSDLDYAMILATVWGAILENF